jgi:hypothetical protein
MRWLVQIVARLTASLRHDSGAMHALAVLSRQATDHNQADRLKEPRSDGV